MSDNAVGHELKWHTSYWPLILSVGILFLGPFSFVSHFVYKSSLMAIVSLGVGVPLTLISIIGWVKEGYEDAHGYGMGYSVWAMPMFIVAEAMLFIGFFAAYWATRLSAPAWPPAGTPEIGLSIPILMTVILVTSSITIHFAEKSLEHDDQSGLLMWIIITMVLGAVFFGFTAYEWNEFFHEGFNFKTNIFSTSFFSITGFHASHVIVGLAVFCCVLIPALAGKTNKPLLRAASIYWHFVDIVWFFVVSQMYFW